MSANKQIWLYSTALHIKTFIYLVLFETFGFEKMWLKPKPWIGSITQNIAKCDIFRFFFFWLMNKVLVAIYLCRSWNLHWICAFVLNVFWRLRGWNKNKWIRRGRKLLAYKNFTNSTWTGKRWVTLFLKGCTFWTISCREHGTQLCLLQKNNSSWSM